MMMIAANLKGGLEVFAGHGVATRVRLLGGGLTVGTRASLVCDLQTVSAGLHQIRAGERPWW